MGAKDTNQSPEETTGVGDKQESPRHKYVWGNKVLIPLIKMALDEGQLNKTGTLFPGKEHPAVTKQKTEWDSEPVSTI